MMFKYFLMSLAMLFFACDSKEKNIVADNYAPLIEKAKATEATLQKQADSMMQKLDSIGFPTN